MSSCAEFYGDGVLAAVAHFSKASQETEQFNFLQAADKFQLSPFCAERRKYKYVGLDCLSQLYANS